MCLFHWGMVQVPLQRTIVRLYNNGRVRAGYQEAVLNAVNQVQDLINYPDENPFRFVFRDYPPC